MSDFDKLDKTEGSDLLHEEGELDKEIELNGLKVGEILVSAGVIDKERLSRLLLSQSNIEKVVKIKPKLLDLVFGVDIKSKVAFLDENHIPLMIGERLLKQGLITEAELINILKIQLCESNNGRVKLFGEILLKEKMYCEKILKFLEENGYVEVVDIDMEGGTFLR